MRKTKRGGDGLTRSHESRRARNGNGEITESLASVLEKTQKTKRGGDLTRRSHKSRREMKELMASVLEDFWGTKKGGDDLTRRSSRSRKTRHGGEGINKLLTSGDLHGHFYQDAWTGLSDEVKSNLSKSVASLALCNGDTVLFACSGIAIESQEHLTRFLTSASLVTAFSNAEKGHEDLHIEVRHESKMCEGFLAEYDLDQNFAVVIIRTFLDVNIAAIPGVEILPRGTVLALAHVIFGKLKTTNVILADNLSGSEDNECLTCKISEVWEGGPLFTLDGNFVGMNLFLDMERAFFIPWGTILKWLIVRFGATPVGCTNFLSKEQLKNLDVMGYPETPMVYDGMILVNTFEETFGDIYPKGVWRELSKKASSNIDRYVVALASFNGDKRSFACTGFFIEWDGSTAILTSASLVRSPSDENRIDENLRIEVLLPSKRRIAGTLQHYSLHYNIALVSVKDCRVVRPAKAQHCRFGWSKLAAVGRCFESVALMAMGGDMVSWSGTLDCRYIVRSTCKITKAGIGGPLVNLDGEVLGMNFYDTRIGTPFLLWSDIDNILAHFRGKSKAGEVGSDSVPSFAAFWTMDGDHSDRLSRWPVPMPCWRYRDRVDKDKSENELVVFDPRTGRKKRYGYIRGVKVELY